MRRRLVVLTLSLAALGGVIAPMAARADSGDREPWACVANQRTHLGVCVYDPIPYVSPQGH